MMKEMYYSFSDRTRYLRFHGPIKSFPHARLQVFCNVDYSEEMALIGTIGDPGSEEVIAVGRYLHDAANNTAEVAFVVRDDWQNRGLGKITLRQTGRNRPGTGYRDGSSRKCCRRTSRCCASFTIPTAACRRPPRVMSSTSPSTCVRKKSLGSPRPSRPAAP